MESQPQRRRALFGVHKEYTDALEASLAQTEQSLAEAKAENAGLEEDLQSARLALKETTGWSERLPPALQELASLAAGELDGEYAEQELAEAVLELAGEHLLASVDIKRGDPAGEIESETQRNEHGRPIRTSVRAGTCTVDCAWQPGIEAGPDTAEVVESLCRAVVFSLAGVEGARAERDTSPSSATRHPSQGISPCAGAGAAGGDRQRDGGRGERDRVQGAVWSYGVVGSLAQTAAILDRLARGHGGQAYQAADREFRLLVDADQAEQACELAEEALADQDGLIFRLSTAQR